jgi:hypothetical protein
LAAAFAVFFAVLLPPDGAAGKSWRWRSSIVMAGLDPAIQAFLLMMPQRR